MSKNILITGSSGYVGAMLVATFLHRTDVEKIIGIDKDSESEFTLNLPDQSRRKFIFIKANLATDNWQQKIESQKIDVIVHCAWQIKSIYGKKRLSYDWNLQSAEKVFDFAWTQKVSKLIHFSTVASYGAEKGNVLEKVFTESDDLRFSKYHYAEEKRLVENMLENKFVNESMSPQVTVIRPASIAGPRRKMNKKHFNLQSALSGNIEGVVGKVIKTLTSQTPVTRNWLRQYVHEDDIVAMVEKIIFDESLQYKYEIFNACPPGEVVLGKDMANMVDKSVLYLHPQVVRVAFAFAWHASLGRVPTSPYAWLTYSYPIPVDGSKITKLYNYKYSYNTREAFLTKSGKFK